MFGLIAGSMQNRESDPKQLADQFSCIVVTTLALKSEVIAQDAPCRFRKVGVPVCQEACTASLAGKSNGASLMNVKIRKCCRENRSCFRRFARFRNRQKELVIIAICVVFGPKPIEELGLRFIIDGV